MKEVPAVNVEPEVLEVDLPEVTLSALAWGPADGPLVVALHGFPDTAWTWRHLGPHLADLGWRVVAPHLRGYAPSGLPRDRCFHVAAVMADAVGLHERLGGDDRAVLVGHDWGAIAANALAGNDESPFGRVVTLAVPPLPAMAGFDARLVPQADAVELVHRVQPAALPARAHARAAGPQALAGLVARATTPATTCGTCWRRWRHPVTAPRRSTTTGRWSGPGRCRSPTGPGWPPSTRCRPVPCSTCTARTTAASGWGTPRRPRSRCATSPRSSSCPTPATSSRSSSRCRCNGLVAGFVGPAA